MAAAARPDARVPCPLCGGLIHPIAGRCKHCKGDVTAVRAARPAAAASLPALHPAAAVAPQRLLGNGAGNVNGNVISNGAPAGAGMNGHAAHAPGANGHAAYAGHAIATAHPQALVQAVAGAGAIPDAFRGLRTAEESQQILPPRPTGRYPTAAPPRASWRSWPVVVIVLAVIAIVAAVVLMVFPPGGAGTDAEAGRRRAAPPRTPAPDRMDTRPTPTPTPRLPPSSGADPWAGQTAPAPTPSPRVPSPNLLPPSADPDPDPDPAPDEPPAPDDPDATPDPGSASRDPFSRRGAGFGPQSNQMLAAIFQHACAHATACGSMTPELRLACEPVAALRMPAPTCAAAARCLQSIDELSCDVSLSDPMKVLQLQTQLDDCAAALRC